MFGWLQQAASAAVVLLGMLGAPLAANAQGSGASPAKSEEAKTQELVNRLGKVIDEGEKTRTADPKLIKALRDVLRDYDNPWRVAVLRDDFKDGDYTSGTRWTVAQGEFWVDWLGLRSNVAVETAARAESSAQQTSQSGNKQEPAAAILGALLGQLAKREGGGQQQQASQEPTGPRRAEIHAPASFSNAFAMRMELSAREGGGSFVFGPYPGSDRATGYRLAYAHPAPDKPAILELLRLSGRGSAVIDQAENMPGLEDTNVHVLEWTRARNGEMVVTVDAKEVMRIPDRSIKDSFGGFVMTNLGGDYAVREVAINGAQ